MMRNLALDQEPFRPYVNDYSDENGSFDFAIGINEGSFIDPYIATVEVYEVT